MAREGSVAGWGAKDTVLISRKPFTPEYLARARQTMSEGRMQAVYMPDVSAYNPFSELLLSPNPAEFYRNYRYNVSPVSDNRPFFFYSVQPRDLWAFVTGASRESADYKINRAVPLLFGLMAVSAIATLIVLALPPLLLGTRLPREPAFCGFSFILCVLAPATSWSRSR